MHYIWLNCIYYQTILKHPVHIREVYIPLRSAMYAVNNNTIVVPQIHIDRLS